MRPQVRSGATCLSQAGHGLPWDTTQREAQLEKRRDREESEETEERTARSAGYDSVIQQAQSHTWSLVASGARASESERRADEREEHLREVHANPEDCLRCGVFTQTTVRCNVSANVAEWSVEQREIRRSFDTWHSAIDLHMRCEPCSVKQGPKGDVEGQTEHQTSMMCRKSSGIFQVRFSDREVTASSRTI